MKTIILLLSFLSVQVLALPAALEESKAQESAVSQEAPDVFYPSELESVQQLEFEVSQENADVIEKIFAPENQTFMCKVRYQLKLVYPESAIFVGTLRPTAGPQCLLGVYHALDKNADIIYEVDQLSLCSIDELARVNWVYLDGELRDSPPNIEAVCEKKRSYSMPLDHEQLKQDRSAFLSVCNNDIALGYENQSQITFNQYKDDSRCMASVKFEKIEGTLEEYDCKFLNVEFQNNYSDQIDIIQSECTSKQEASVFSFLELIMAFLALLFKSA